MILQFILGMLFVFTYIVIIYTVLTEKSIRRAVALVLVLFLLIFLGSEVEERFIDSNNSVISWLFGIFMGYFLIIKFFRKKLNSMPDEMTGEGVAAYIIFGPMVILIFMVIILLSL